MGLYSTAEHYRSGAAAKVLRYFQYDRAASLTCPQCGWVGPGSAASTNMFKELFDVCCPRCDKMLRIVALPTLPEIEDAARKGNEGAQRQLDAIRRAEERGE